MSQDQPSAGGFVGLEHRLPVRVYYEDTDFSGVVYHANYLRFFERGRTDALRVLGVHHTELLADGCAFVVRRMEIDFIRSAKVDDALLVRSTFQHARGARMNVAQSIDRGGERLATAKVEAAIVGLDGRPRRLAADILGRLAPFLPDSKP